MTLSLSLATFCRPDALSILFSSASRVAYIRHRKDYDRGLKHAAHDAFWEFSNNEHLRCQVSWKKMLGNNWIKPGGCPVRFSSRPKQYWPSFTLQQFLRNLGTMPKASTHALSNSRKHTTGFLVKRFVEWCGSRLQCWRPPVTGR